MTHRILFLLIFPMIFAGAAAIVSGYPAKEPLTAKEILQIQANKPIDIRVQLYMEAAIQRLKTVEERLAGKEPEEGDPFEFYTPEDMIDGYCQILKTVMINLDDIYQKPRTSENLGKALKHLKEGTERNGKELEVLKRYAEDQKKEKLWDIVNRAIEMTTEAHKGAEFGLSKQPPDSSPQRRKGR